MSWRHVRAFCGSACGEHFHPMSCGTTAPPMIASGSVDRVCLRSGRIITRHVARQMTDDRSDACRKWLTSFRGRLRTAFATNGCQPAFTHVTIARPGKGAPEIDGVSRMSRRHGPRLAATRPRAALHRTLAVRCAKSGHTFACLVAIPRQRRWRQWDLPLPGMNDRGRQGSQNSDPWQGMAELAAARRNQGTPVRRRILPCW